MRRTKRGGFFPLSTRLTKPNPMSFYLQVRADRVNEKTIPSPSSSYSSLFFRSLPSSCFPFIFFFASLCFSPPLLFFFPSPMLFFFPPLCSSSPLLLIFFPPLDFLLPLLFFPLSLSLLIYFFLNPHLLLEFPLPPPHPTNASSLLFLSRSLQRGVRKTSFS